MPIDWNIVDDPEPAAPVEPSDALDGRRIHAIVLERREAHRARLRAVLVPIACAAVALMAIAQAWVMHTRRPGRAAASGAIAVMATWAGRRAAKSRSLATSKAADAAVHPNFEALPDARSAVERLGDLDR